MEHPALSAAFEELRRMLREPADTGIIFVSGPTGAGKTTLLRMTEKVLDEEALPIIRSDPERMGPKTVEIPPPGTTKFTMKPFLRRGLEVFEEPIAREKRASIDDLSQQLYTTMGRRRPPAFLVDEAHHFLLGKGAASLESETEALKYIGNLAAHAQVPHVLFGVYDLVISRGLNSQLVRRSRDIHLPRYRSERRADVLAFQSVLVYFLDKLPLQLEADLEDEWKYFYAGSIGCVGTLKSWLVRALAVAMEDRARKMTRRHLERAQHFPDELKKMLDDARKGEAVFDEREREADNLWHVLGLEASKKSAGKQHQTQAKSGKGRPGERDPHRDPVGFQNVG